MKTQKFSTLLFISSIVILGSCTIQKRTFNSGYHIEWKKKYTSSKSSEATNEDLLQTYNTSNSADKDLNSTETLYAGINEDAIDFENKRELNAENSTTKTEVNQFSSSEQQLEIKSKIAENVVVVKHDNSEKEIRSSYSFISKESSKAESKKPKSAPENGGKLQVVALVLCIFLGLLGIHRFYLGYTGMGVLYLLTLGLFGIGWIIDIILLIIPNGLTPKGKSNYKKD